MTQFVGGNDLVSARLVPCDGRAETGARPLPDTHIGDSSTPVMGTKKLPCGAAGDFKSPLQVNAKRPCGFGCAGPALRRARVVSIVTYTVIDERPRGPRSSFSS
jgi:hypothetical protein